MFIDITQEDIDNGSQNDPSCCPIALACKRIGFLDPLVNGRGVIWRSSANKNAEMRSSILSEEGKIFVDEFDAGYPVKPFILKIWPGTY